MPGQEAFRATVSSGEGRGLGRPVSKPRNVHLSCVWGGLIQFPDCAGGI